LLTLDDADRAILETALPALDRLAGALVGEPTS
jgi:hypothetical protein